jgi:integrase
VISRPRPPHLVKERDRHKNVIWYVRVGHGPRKLIKHPYGTPEFDDAYALAVRGERATRPGSAAKGTLKWLWDLYRKSEDWLSLSMATRRQRENIMHHVLEKVGAEQLSAIDNDRIIAGRDARAKTPTQAKHFVTTLRQMYIWAIPKHAKVDPTAGVAFKRSKKDRNVNSGFPVWPDSDIKKYEDHWPIGTRERLLFDIYLYTGLRRGDASAIGPGHVANDIITIETEKGQGAVVVTIPILPELQRSLDATALGHSTWFASLAGHPMTKESVGNFFKDCCVAAGILDKSGHGVRKAAATEAAENEATHAQLNSIFGWTGHQMASLYTESASRKKLAAEAIGKLSRNRKPTSNPAQKASERDLEEKDQ